MTAAIERYKPAKRQAIEVVGQRKSYPGGVEAVEGIDFAVAPGEVFPISSHRDGRPEA